jgi:hypothetical protein
MAGILKADGAFGVSLALSLEGEGIMAWIGDKA